VDDLVFSGNHLSNNYIRIATDGEVEDYQITLDATMADLAVFNSACHNFQRLHGRRLISPYATSDFASRDGVVIQTNRCSTGDSEMRL
jgi:hypothetical protein